MAFFLRGRPLSQRLVRIQAIPIFSTLDVRGLRIVEGLMHERSYAPGEVIFDAGEEGQAIYLCPGRVELCRKRFDQYQRQAVHQQHQIGAALGGAGAVYVLLGDDVMVL